MFSEPQDGHVDTLTVVKRGGGTGNCFSWTDESESMSNVADAVVVAAAAAVVVVVGASIRVLLHVLSVDSSTSHSV